VLVFSVGYIVFLWLHMIINSFSGATDWAADITVNQKPQRGASKGKMIYSLWDFLRLFRHSVKPWICLFGMYKSRCISKRMSWDQLLSMNKLGPTNRAWTPYTTVSRSDVIACALHISQHSLSLTYTFNSLSLCFRWKMRR